MKKNGLLLVSLSALAVVTAPAGAPAYAFPDFLSKWMPFLFDKEEAEGPPPEETLQAPFPTDSTAAPAAPSRNALDGLYQEEENVNNNLSLEHRHPDQVGAWLEEKVSQNLTFSPEGYAQHIAVVSESMSNPAQSQFKTFLQNANILQTMQGRRLSLHSYTEGAPIMLNKGTLGGRFRWVFDVPVVMSFLSAESSGYETSGPAINERIWVKVQVGRIAGDEEHNLIIESWDVRKHN